jgi:hypothetical protein
MKIKKFNELFDSPDLKYNLEIPYLKGDLKKDIPNWKSATGANPLIDRIGYHCPFILNMDGKSNGNLLSIGFTHDIKFSVNDFAFIYFSIQVRDLGGDKYICQIFARATRKGRELYGRQHESKKMNFEELTRFIDDDGYNILTEFNRWTLDNFDYMGSEHLGPEDKPKNIRKN